MNVLAEEQKKLFVKGISQAEFEKKQEEFFKLYYKIRTEEEGRIWNKLSLEQRKSLHKLVLSVYQTKNFLQGFKYDIIKDEREQTPRPIIFVPTHVGKYDIEVTSPAIKDHYYLLSGDYEHIQGTIDERFLSLNGVFYFNEKDKADRKAVVAKMINHLKAGGNLMYFIEGTWNITPNLPMLPCYWGIVDIAKKSNAIIIPVASEQYGKLFKINIGKNFDMNNYDDGLEEKARAISDLRDTLATLKWEIWETEPVKRENLTGHEWEEYVEKRFKEWPYFNEEYIAGLIFKPKNVTTKEEVYGPVKKLVPNKNNAFIFNKRLSDDIFN